MPTPNPYQPPGSRDVAWTDRPLQPREDRMARTKSPRRLISFLTLQFVAFVPTMFVLHVLWFCFGVGLERAVYLLLDTQVSLAWIAGGDIALWLPHARDVVGTQLFVVSPAIGGDVWRVGICSNINVS